MDNKAMFKIGYGLYVLTACEDGRDNGCIINTVMQVTSSPNRIAIAVNKLNHTGGMIDRRKVFNISVLTNEADFSVFQSFGFRSGADVDKFESFRDIKRSGNGLLYINKATNAYISAAVTEQVDLGTHIMYIADVTDAEILGNAPTVTYDYYQQNIKPKSPATAATGQKSAWRCDICGYVHEGDLLPSDFICPICKHGSSDFTKLS